MCNINVPSEASIKPRTAPAMNIVFRVRLKPMALVIELNDPKIRGIKIPTIEKSRSAPLRLAATANPNNGQITTGIEEATINDVKAFCFMV